MAPKTQQAWTLAREQHGVLTRNQLLDLGFTPEAIRHRRETGRLHRLHRGIYAVGRPGLDRYGADKLGLTDPEAHDRRRDRAGARGGHDPRGDP